jgi:hypothetical protein
MLSNNSAIKENFDKLFSYNDNTEIILEDLKNTDKNNLNLLLNKIKIINDKEESFFLEKHEENLNYIKDHDNIILAQINQLKQLTEKTQIQIEEEKNLRKINNDKMLKDIINYVENKYEEKFQIMEKNILETEKNLVNMNKDYVKTLKEIMNKQKDGNEIEFHNLKNMFEIGIKNSQTLYDKDINEVKKLMTELKGEINDNNRNIEKMEGFVNENVKIMRESKINGDKSLEDFSKKMSRLDKDLNRLLEDTKKQLEKTLENSITKASARMEKFETNINDIIISKLHPYDTYIQDLKERDSQLQKMIENKYEQLKSETDAIGVKNLKLDEIYTNKFSNINKDLQDNIKQVKEEIENNKEILKTYIKKNMDEYSLHVDNDLYKKFEVLKNDIKEDFEKSKIELDGKAQQYVLESESRIKNEIQEKVK